MSISDTQKLTTLHPEVNGQLDNNTNIYPNVPRYLTLCYNLIVNGNGAQFEGDSSPYKFLEIPSEMLPEPYRQYTIYVFTYGGTSIYNTNPVTDLGKIKEYLTFMTGSDYVPVYNATQPNECFLWKSQDDTCWKLQYTDISDIGSVLLAFKVDEDKLPLMKTIKKMTKGQPKTLFNFNKTIDTENNKIILTTADRISFDIEENSNHFLWKVGIDAHYFDQNTDDDVYLNGGSLIMTSVLFAGIVGVSKTGIHSGGAGELFIDDSIKNAKLYATSMQEEKSYSMENITIELDRDQFDDSVSDMILSISLDNSFNYGG